MNIFIKAAIVLVVTLMGVFVAFIVVNTPWVTAISPQRIAPPVLSVPTVLAAPTLPAIPTALATPTVFVKPTVLAVPTENPCLKDGRIFYNSMQILFAQWDAGMKMALPLPPESLGPAIEKLQEVQRKMMAVDAPPCLRAAHDTTIKAMDEAIKAYLGMLANEPASVVEEHFNNFSTLLDDAKSQIFISIGK